MTRATLKKKPKAPAARAALAMADRSAKKPDVEANSEHGGRWTFLTNHAHVLLLLARHPSMVLREVATLVKITERAVQRIIADLEEGGFIEREKVGRQNHYRIIPDRKLRHPVEQHRTIGDLLRMINEGS